MRTNYEMSAEDLNKLLDAMKPAPLIMAYPRPPISVQENANAAWAVLGARMGFDPMTVRPNGKGSRFFSAETTLCRGIEIEPGVYSGCSASGGDCPVCGK